MTIMCVFTFMQIHRERNDTLVGFHNIEIHRERNDTKCVLSHSWTIHRERNDT